MCPQASGMYRDSCSPGVSRVTWPTCGNPFQLGSDAPKISFSWPGCARAKAMAGNPSPFDFSPAEMNTRFP